MEDLTEIVIHVPFKAEGYEKEELEKLCLSLKPPTFMDWFLGKRRHITVSLKIRVKVGKK